MNKHKLVKMERLISEEPIGKSPVFSIHMATLTQIIPVLNPNHDFLAQHVKLHRMNSFFQNHLSLFKCFPKKLYLLTTRMFKFGSVLVRGLEKLIAKTPTFKIAITYMKPKGNFVGGSTTRAITIYKSLLNKSTMSLHEQHLSRNRKF